MTTASARIRKFWSDMPAVAIWTPGDDHVRDEFARAVEVEGLPFWAYTPTLASASYEMRPPNPGDQFTITRSYIGYLDVTVWGFPTDVIRNHFVDQFAGFGAVAIVDDLGA